MQQDASVNEDDFTVFIGKKDTGTYIFSVETQAKTNDRILIRARGGYAISKAVNVSQVAINRSLKGWKMGEVKILTEKIEFNAEGEQLGYELKDRFVSAICIEIKKEVERTDSR